MKNLFDEIKKASVPPKFNQDFLETHLGLKSSSYRAMIPLMKKLGFLDSANVPTQAYKDFRDENQSGTIMAQQIKETYNDLFKAHEYANRLTKDELITKLKTMTGASKDDKVIPCVAGTFLELVKQANFDTKGVKAIKITPEEVKLHPTTPRSESSKLGISYTINLNLPASTDIEVFNAIFKALKEHILNE